MTRRTTLAALIGLALAFAPQAARADQPASSAAPEAGRHRIPPHLKIDKSATTTSMGSGSWWVGTVVIALTLAGLGVASLTARKFLPGSSETRETLKVVGRTSLSPKHTVHLLKAGDRVLIVGTGPQGAPSLLGELDDPDEIARLTTARSNFATTPMTAANRFLTSVTRKVGGTV